jgi:hypothetical protein
MKTDTYIKIVLTVIAICLVALVLKPFDSGILVSNANAQGYETSRTIDVNIKSIDGKTFGATDVSLIHTALPVKIIGN